MSVTQHSSDDLAIHCNASLTSQEVYKAFKQHITGSHEPLPYNTEATEAIAKFIADSVADGSNNAVAKDLRSYFIPVPREPVDTCDL